MLLLQYDQLRPGATMTKVCFVAYFNVLLLEWTVLLKYLSYCNKKYPFAHLVFKWTNGQSKLQACCSVLGVWVENVENDITYVELIYRHTV